MAAKPQVSRLAGVTSSPIKPPLSQISRLTTATSTHNKTQQSAASIGDPTAESLAAIREEPPNQSSMLMATSKSTTDDLRKDLLRCVCRRFDEQIKTQRQTAEEIEQLLKDKETELRAEYDKILDRELAFMKERFDFILSNEQTRACYMLREAHRERKEKIAALQSQLECKNLAALMYVMCTERRRSKLEKLRIIRDYTNYINQLQDILQDGQELILHLSRGYKTAARVDHEWREKMKKVITEFMNFIHHFAGGSPESNQYFFDMPTLLKTEASIIDNPNEDPCDGAEAEVKPVYERPEEKTWWEKLDDERRPFIMFGDMAEFAPAKRREILKTVKAKKTAPARWRTYAFNDMFLNASCKHLSEIKDLYPEKLPVPSHWECPIPTRAQTQFDQKAASKLSLADRREFQSVDIRGTMGSLLKIMTTANVSSAPQVTTKTALLGARDSMEIQSTTRLARQSIKAPEPVEPEPEQDCTPLEIIDKPKVLAVGKRRPSAFEQMPEEEEYPNPEPPPKKPEEADEDVTAPDHTDSLQVIPQVISHAPENEPRIYYERVCPMEKCRLMQVDSFMRSLPSYMRMNPFEHFANSYDGYETCTPEQLEVLKQRIEAKKAKEAEDEEVDEEDPIGEWLRRGVAVQTSDVDMSLPPCTCHVPSPTPVSSNFVFNFEDLMPVKQAMDAIHKECLYDERIDFDRFKIIGSEESLTTQETKKNEFKPIKFDEIKRILAEDPSLLDIFNPDSATPKLI